VPGNTTTVNTHQLVVQGPVLVLNSAKLNQATGFVFQQSSGDAGALVLQSGTVDLMKTASDANAASLTASSYLPLRTGSLTAQGTITVVPPATANGYMVSASGTYDAASSVHVIPASSIDVANSGSGVYAGQLMIFVTNNDLTATNKTGYASISLIKSPPDFDVVPISVHRNVNLGTLEIGKSAGGTDVVVLTDSDCGVSWKFEGATIR